MVRPPTSEPSGPTGMDIPAFRVVGARLPRADARDKVYGLLRYADDLALTGMLHARVVRATRPSARLVSIDVGA